MNTVYIVANDSLYRSTDAGATWNVISKIPVDTPDQVVIDYYRNNPNFIYIAFLKEETLHLYNSTNSGISWSFKDTIVINNIFICP